MKTISPAPLSLVTALGVALVILVFALPSRRSLEDYFIQEIRVKASPANLPGRNVTPGERGGVFP